MQANNLKRGDCFASYEEFARVFDEYKSATGTTFRVQNSETVKNYKKKHEKAGEGLDIPSGVRYMFLKLVCVHYGEPRSRGTGVRKKQRYLASCCEASVTVKYSRQRRCLEIVDHRLEHQHNTDPVLQMCYSQHRARVLKEQVQTGEPVSVQVLKYDPNLKLLQRDLTKSGTFVTAKDLYNMRARLQARQGSEGEQLIDVLSTLLNDDPGAAASLSLSPDDQLQMVAFQTSRMATLFEAFPEVILIDGTYRVNKNRYAFYPFLSTDGFGAGRFIFGAILQDDQESSLSNMVECFKSSNPAWTKIRTIITDKDVTELNVLRTALPDARILLCLFHVLKAFRLKISTLATKSTDEKVSLLDLAKKMVYAKNEEAFKSGLLEVEKACPAFYDYLQDNWMGQKDMWAMHLRKCITYGNNTNSRVESFNQKVKEVTGTSDTMATCVEKILALNSAAEQKIMFEIYQNDCTTVSVKGQDTTAAIFYNLYTDYAAQLCCQQWAMVKKARYALFEESKDGKYTVRVGRDQRYQVALDLTSCTCSFNTSHVLPCRHMLYVMRELEEEPKESMVADKWLKSYQRSAILGLKEKPAAEVRPLILNNKEHQLPSRVMTRQQKFLKAKNSLLELASLLCEVGQKEFNQRLQVIKDLHAHWKAGSVVSVQVNVTTTVTDQSVAPKMVQSAPDAQSSTVNKVKSASDDESSVGIKVQCAPADQSTTAKDPSSPANQSSDAKMLSSPDDNQSFVRKNMMTAPTDGQCPSEKRVIPSAADKFHTVSPCSHATAKPSFSEEMQKAREIGSIQVSFSEEFCGPTKMEILNKEDQGKKIKLCSIKIRGRLKGTSRTYNQKGNRKEGSKRKTFIKSKNLAKKVKLDLQPSTQARPGEQEEQRQKTQETSHTEGERASHTEREDFWTPYLPRFSTTEDLTIERLTKIHSKTPLSVCGYKLRLDDLLTLVHPNWLCDQVVDAYLALLAKKFPGTVFMLPCQLPIKWKKNEMDWLFEKVCLRSFGFILLPVCCGVNPSTADFAKSHGQHWTLLVANVKARSVGVLNSMPGVYKEELAEILRMWNEFMQMRSQVTLEDLSVWAQQPLHSGIQGDGSSCGVFVLMNAEAVLRGTATDSLSQWHVNSYRTHIYQELVAENESNVCGANEKCTQPTSSRLVQCQNCHVWLHHACEKILRKPRNFICTMCRGRKQEL